jgi:chromatin remodeling complex protein RSC6
MVRTTKTPATTTTATKTTATPAKTTTKTATKTATKTTTKTAAVTTPVVVTAPVEIESTDEPVSTEPTIFDQFSGFMGKLQAVSSSMSALRTEFRGLERQVTRELKAAAKLAIKRKRKSGNRAPSGFVKPTLISNELAAFLGKPEGSEMARTEVTREINAYIREHKLQDVTNGRKIIPDKKLTGLLKIKKGDELTYFNLQKFMSPHFAKAGDTMAPMSNIPLPITSV